MITYMEALAILRMAEPLNKELLPVPEACGYVLAEHVTSPVRVPAFANSAMDGVAVRATDLTHASRSSPVTLPVVGGSVAGDKPSSGGGGAWEIMTGAPLPEGYDAVVKIEDVAVEDRGVKFFAPIAKGRNIRKAGEDFKPGDAIAKPGTLLTPYHVMALAAVGIREVTVYRKPSITVFSTGRELSDDVNRPLALGRIRNSNGPYLMAALHEMGYGPRYGGTIADDPEQFATKLQEALPQADVIVSTGAVSAGKHDFISDCLCQIGADIRFHKIKIRPGKPALYARFADGAHYFGLPGNPISVAAGLRFLVTPLLGHLQAMKPETPMPARLRAPSPKKSGLRFFLKARLSAMTDGAPHLTILDGQESFKIHPMLRANCWAVLTEEQTGAKTGETVALYPLLPDRWALGSLGVTSLRREADSGTGS
ncbi:MAG: gephyrin-like molybdotransferase Glp [Hyphomicrobiales bacterium]